MFYELCVYYVVYHYTFSDKLRTICPLVLKCTAADTSFLQRLFWTHFDGFLRAELLINYVDFKTQFYAQESTHGTYPFETKQTLLSNNSHDSGYADSHPHASTNGWIPSASASNNPQMRSPNDLQHQDQFMKRTGPTFAYQATTTAHAPPASTRSLSGSNDSLLSNGSSSGHSQNAHQQHQGTTSHPALPPKGSSFRHSGNNYLKNNSAGSK